MQASAILVELLVAVTLFSCPLTTSEFARHSAPALGRIAPTSHSTTEKLELEAQLKSTPHTDNVGEQNVSANEPKAREQADWQDNRSTNPQYRSNEQTKRQHSRQAGKAHELSRAWPASKEVGYGAHALNERSPKHTHKLTNHFKHNDDHLHQQQSRASSGAARRPHLHRVARESVAREVSSREGRCEGGRAPQIYGLRCDSAKSVEAGILVVKANELTELTLLGVHLDGNISVALTPEAHSAQADCTHADRVKLVELRTTSANVARVLIHVAASVGPRRPYFFCLRDSLGQWRHQGSESWLKLYVEEDLLPVYMKIVLVACLLLLSGLFSGLNLGLMALDKNELQVIISCGSETEKRYARAIEPVRRRGNYLLCSILFSNVLVNSTIAVLLEELTSGIVAVMTSTIFIVMFGEILPQAFCSRHGLAVGAKTVSITYFCMVVTFPLSYPVSSMLDWALGEEIGHAYDRERLMEFIRVTRDYNNLEADEVNIISGALKLKRITVSEVMTRIEDVFMLDMNSRLDFHTIQAIIERGYSRIPVHEPNDKNNVLALLLAKDLALLNPSDRTPVQTLIAFYNHPVLHLFEDSTLDLALNEFKTGKSHMAFVRRVIDDGHHDPVYEITGIVTLEDVIEEIIQMEINDETDTLTDNRRKRRRIEAQVRRDFAQLTANFLAADSSSTLIAPQLCLAAYQYLATAVEPFASSFISDAVLRRLLAQRIYFRVQLDRPTTSTINKTSEHTNKLTSERRLYTAGEPADYFIMILEGRVQVTCGKENLAFEAGPFSYFGKAALTPATPNPDRLLDTPMLAILSGQQQQVGAGAGAGSEAALGGKPQTGGSGERSHRDSFIELKRLASGAVAFKRMGDTFEVQQEAGSKRKVSASSSVASQKNAQLTSANAARLKSSGSRSSINSLERPNALMVPDYTVEVVCDTCYLKITRLEYLAALRATLFERGCRSTIEQEEELEEVDLADENSALVQQVANTDDSKPTAN